MLLCVVAVSAYASPRSISDAEAEVARVRGVVEAGAMPRSALDRAEQELAEARDQQSLQQMLYGSVSVDDLTREQTAEMVGAAQQHFDRQQEKVNAARKLVDAGVAARTSLTPLLEELDARRRTLDLANSRARLLEELAAMIQVEVEESEAEPRPGGPLRVAERYDGDGSLTHAEYLLVRAAFENRYSRPLPISAYGDTPLHRSLGFDHRGRVDVALNPDQEEGEWLLRYLEGHRIPYFAFRAAVRGKATGAHIHLGPPSNRLRTAD